MCPNSVRFSLSVYENSTNRRIVIAVFCNDCQMDAPT